MPKKGSFDPTVRYVDRSERRRTITFKGDYETIQREFGQYGTLTRSEKHPNVTVLAVSENYKLVFVIIRVHQRLRDMKSGL